MGNRAVIAYQSMPQVGIYVHWNGGPESVLAFLTEAEERGARSPGADAHYSFSRLAQVITEFFSQPSVVTGEPDYAHNVGVGPLDSLDTDNMDNGLYWIADDWSIAKREYAGSAPALTVEDLPTRERKQHEAIVQYLKDLRLTKADAA